MYNDNILKAGARFAKSITSRAARGNRLAQAAKNAAGPTKIFYLWEKHGVKRIEMFCME
jgi:hypothetical protein